MRTVNWQQCQEYARDVDDDGRERTVVCHLDAHCSPGDTTASHYDRGLGVSWKFSDDPED